METAVRDSRNSASSGVNFDGLTVLFDSSEGLLRLDITPSSVSREPLYLTHGSALAVVAGSAVWQSYPSVQRIAVTVHRKPEGNASTPPANAAYMEFSRARWEGVDYRGLRDQPRVDNKTMFCNADFYDVSITVWASLFNPGCMTLSIGGTSPNDSQQQMISKAKEEQARLLREQLRRDGISVACDRAKDYVTAVLKAPSTAKFQGCFDPTDRVFARDDDSFVVTGYVDAQNSFGAMIRSTYVVVLRPTDDSLLNWTLVEIHVD